MKKKKQLKYTSTIQLLIFEGEMLWIILSTYLVANTILLGFVGQMISTNKITAPVTNWPCFLAGVLGLILVIPWTGTFLRNSAYYKLRMEQAKEVEPKKFSLLRGKGEAFSKGD